MARKSPHSPHLAVGIDLGGTNVKGALIDATGRVKARSRRLTGAERGPEAVVENIVAVIEELRPETAAGTMPLGLSIPGEVNDAGEIWRLPNIAGFEGYAIGPELVARTGLGPVAVDNDAICAAFAEHAIGAGQKYDNFLQVTLGTGIGGGLVLKGNVHRGHDGFGAEIGHVAIHHSGRKCGCGARGCIEAYAGARGILRTYRNLGGKGSTVAEVSTNAAAGEKAALQCLEQVGHQLGHAMASILNVLNLDAIIFSGGIRKAMGFMKPAMQETLRERCMGEPVSRLPLLLTRLSDDAGAIGAALMAMGMRK